MKTALDEPNEPWPLHPFLLALLPLLGVYSQNVGIVGWDSLVRPMCVLLGASLVLWLLCIALLRGVAKGSLAASILIFCSLTGWRMLEEVIRVASPNLANARYVPYSAAYAAVVIAGGAAAFVAARKYRPDWVRFTIVFAVLLLVAPAAGAVLLAPLFGLTASWLMAVYILLVGAWLALAIKATPDYRALTRSLNWFAGILVALYTALIALNSGQSPAPAAAPIAAEAPAPDAQPPDIYLIVMDGYARSDVLAAVYGYNDMPFQSALRDKGFVFARDSFTNYPYSMPALAACLNMDYLDALAPAAAPDTSDMRLAAGLFQDNRLFTFLEGRGYRIVSVGECLASTALQRSNVECIEPAWTPTEFESVLIENTAVRRVLGGYHQLQHGNAGFWRIAATRKRVRFAFDALPQLAAASSDAPRFVFTHVPVPDAPFLFDRSGDWPRTGTDFEERYRSQLYFAEERVAQAVDAILERSAREPVLVLISPHGPGLYMDPHDPEKSDLAERFGNLIAVRLPEGYNGTPVYDGMSLVNLFRGVLGIVAGTDLPALPDRAWFCSERRPLQCVEVTVPKRLP